MKNVCTVLFCVFTLVGCGTVNHLRGIETPIMYDNATVSIITDNVLSIQQDSDKSIMPQLASRLDGFSKAEILKQGSMKVTQSCGDRTMKVVQEITDISTNTVTDIKTGFFLTQLFRGTATSTKSDIINVNATLTVTDCQSGKILGTHSNQFSNQSLINILREIAEYNIWFAYSYQRGGK
jgi:hypothetical protein